MPGFMLTIAIVAATFGIIQAFSKADEKPPDPNSSSRSSGSTRTQPSDQPPPYTPAHKQTSTRTPATTVNCRCPHHSSHASPHGGDSRQRPMASARTDAFNQFSSSDRILGTHPAARTPSSTGYNRRDRSVFDSGSPRESRHTFSPSTGTQSAHQAPLGPSRSQTTAKTSTTIDYNRSLFDSDFDQLLAVEPRQTTTASARPRASYQHSPEPEPTRIDRYERSWAVPQSPVLTHLSDLESDESDEPQIVEDITVAQELRERARRQDQKMLQARKLAKDAHMRQDYEAERKYNKDATTYDNAKRVLNERAASIIFRENNRGCKEGTFDLHHLHVPEAIRCAKKALRQASLQKYEEVHFIVGKGLHSNGGAKIRPALEELCVERGLTHSLDPDNAGVLTVQVG